MVINHHISNVMVPIGLRAAFHGLIGLESSFEAFPENHGLPGSSSSMSLVSMSSPLISVLGVEVLVLPWELDVGVTLAFPANNLTR